MHDLAVAIRFMGCKLAMSSKAAGFPSPLLGVIVPPANSALTRMPSTAWFDASDFAKSINPAFDAA